MVGKKDNMDSSLWGLDEFDEGGIGGWGGVHRICGYPEVLFAVVDGLPDMPEEVIAVEDKFGEGEPADGFNFPIGEQMVEFDGWLVEGWGEEWIDIHNYNNK